MSPYDLVVIGGGSAGITAARFAARAGARAVLIEADRVGGDCTWTGCVPSKALLQAAAVAQAMRSAADYGIVPVEPRLDLDQVMERVRAARERVYAEETPEKLRSEGVEVVIGRARFLDASRVEVDDRPIEGKRFLVCTGAEPATPAIPGLAETPHLSYLDLYDLRQLPGRLVVLGAGPVGCELAQAFTRLGAGTTLLEAAGRILPIAPPEASAVLREQFEAEGMTVSTGVAVDSVAASGSMVRVSLAGRQLEADLLLVATGRRPRVEGLDLDRAGVKVSEQGIQVDAQLRTTSPHIYAAGDVTGGAQFTHYAGWQGFRAARNALLPGSSPGLRADVPWAVFTDPEIAHVGPDREEAERQGDTQVHHWPLAKLDRAQAAGRPRGYLEVLTHDGVVVGGTCVSAAAGEVANELAVAVEQKLKLSELAATIHVYPTYGFGLEQLAAEAAMASALSGISGRVVRTLLR